MPKKTKKQKILAELHRKLQYPNTFQSPGLNFESSLVKNQNNDSTKNQEPIYSNTIKYVQEPAIKAKTMKIYSSYAYVKSDLIKITIFTVFALTLQCVLYFLIRTR